MKEQLISFDTAKLAREKGCNLIKSRNEIIVCPVPTQSLLQKWLREIHNIDLVIVYLFTGYGYEYYTCEASRQSSVIGTYEQALEEGLKECLKLIKL